MTLKTTPAYITKVGPEHTIMLPPETPVGTTVAVIVVPPSTSLDDAARQKRFAATLAAIRAASASDTPQVTISDGDLDALIKQARRATPAT